MSGLAYLDASALVKLIIDEQETPALQSDIVGRDGLIASRLSVLEASRAIARRPTAARISTMEEITNALVVIEMDARLVDAAASIEPPSLRSLDAIHLASALSLEPQLPDVITYDQRLADAARTSGLTVVQPGR